MKYIVLLLLLNSCVTLGVKSIEQKGEKLCYLDMGLEGFHIYEDMYKEFRWYIVYTCVNGVIYKEGIK